MKIKKLIINYFNKLRKSKRILYISLISLLILFVIALNITFSAFSGTHIKNIANIKVAGMEYSMTINGSAGTIITATKNNDNKFNVSVFSQNNISSKYELIYDVCSTSDCTSFINKPEGLTIEYSSKTVDPITGLINSSGIKNIRIIVTNTTEATYYIKLDINAGYSHNTLALKNLITSEYNEEDVTIAAIVNGEVSTTFPSTDNYYTSIECLTNKGPSNSTGIVNWSGSKWIVNINGTDSGRTICNVYFNDFQPNTLKTLIQVMDMEQVKHIIEYIKGFIQY